LSSIWSVAYTEYLSDPRVRREAEALAARGDEVTVLCLTEAARPNLEVVRGVRVERLPMRRYRGGGAIEYIRGYGQFFVRVALWMARRRRPDVVHVHTIPDILVFATLVPRLRGSRIVLDVHDLTPDLFALKFGRDSPVVRLLRVIERLSFAYPDALITVHEPYRRILESRGVAPPRVHVVMNVAVPDVFETPATLVSRSATGAVTFVYHGTLVERYGIDVLLRAFAKTRAGLPRARLQIYGGGDFRPAALHLADDLGLNGSVQFSSGFVPVDELAPLLRQADIGVVPNRSNPYIPYALPTKLMEYAVLGMPAIVSRTAAVADYFSEDMVCFVRPDDVDDLAQAMLRLGSDAELRKHLATTIGEFAIRHSWAVYKQALFRAIDGEPPF
jgi:glycosyltransferase involved in cell wall biosynthesis